MLCIVANNFAMARVWWVVLCAVYSQGLASPAEHVEVGVDASQQRTAQLLFELTVNVNQQQQKLAYYADQTPEEAARRFCDTHGLTSDPSAQCLEKIRQTIGLQLVKQRDNKVQAQREAEEARKHERERDAKAAEAARQKADESRAKAVAHAHALREAQTKRDEKEKAARETQQKAEAKREAEEINRQAEEKARQAMDEAKRITEQAMLEAQEKARLRGEAEDKAKAKRVATHRPRPADRVRPASTLTAVYPDGHSRRSMVPQVRVQRAGASSRHFVCVLCLVCVSIKRIEIDFFLGSVLRPSLLLFLPCAPVQ